MVYQKSFHFKWNKQNPEAAIAEEETIYQAVRHQGVYDLYVINGLDYHRERVATLIDTGEWTLV